MIKLEIWGGVVFVFLKKYFVFIYVISIEIKIEVKVSWLFYILYSFLIFKNKWCYVYVKYYKLWIILWIWDNCIRICEWYYIFVFWDIKILFFFLGYICVSCKCISKILNNYEGFLINYVNIVIDIYEWW